MTKDTITMGSLAMSPKYHYRKRRPGLTLIWLGCLVIGAMKEFVA